MPNTKKAVSPSYHPPGKVLDHGIVFVMSLSAWRYTSFSPVVKTFVVITNLNYYGFSFTLMLLLTQPVVVEEIVQLADDCVGPLPTITCFIAQKVHLSRSSNSKHYTLPRGQEVDGTWLERVTREVHLS